MGSKNAGRSAAGSVERFDGGGFSFAYQCLDQAGKCAMSSSESPSRGIRAYEGSGCSCTESSELRMYGDQPASSRGVRGVLKELYELGGGREKCLWARGL